MGPTSCCAWRSQINTGCLPPVFVFIIPPWFYGEANAPVDAYRHPDPWNCGSQAILCLNISV